MAILGVLAGIGGGIAFLITSASPYSIVGTGSDIFLSSNCGIDVDGASAGILDCSRQNDGDIYLNDPGIDSNSGAAVPAELVTGENGTGFIVPLAPGKPRLSKAACPQYPVYCRRAAR